MTAFLDAVGASHVYWAVLIFLAAYPILTGVVWVTTSLLYFFRREAGRSVEPLPMTVAPTVSVLIPA